ncbi:hypothetical protein M8009_00175 [Halomonas sp. ATCH28]|uniref:Uncharacterized protein n=1 Tax=Halomonas gemina TaxID=2945105 RepID=A0ABT0SWQ5_9GAMM|nr:hypothetical protein [Halomonas gemina]MCL7938721.1 hypothetical protein [Halomonas gemina]
MRIGVLALHGVQGEALEQEEISAGLSPPFAQLAGGDAPATLDLNALRARGVPCLGLDLARGEIRTVLWATGFRPDYRWLQVPVLDRKGQLRHHGGVVDAPGLYVLGLPFLRRRKSSFIHGADDDARELCAHLADWLAGDRRPGKLPEGVPSGIGA